MGLLIMRKVCFILLFIVIITDGISASVTDVRTACDIVQAEYGCTVSDGHAQCEGWNMAASITGLPACTKKITFSLLANPHFVNVTRFAIFNLSDVDFSHLHMLEELLIFTNRKNYARIRILAEDAKIFQQLAKLRILCIRGQQNTFDFRNNMLGMYNQIKSLEMLELTRSKRISLNQASRVIGPKSVMKILILKNIQEFRREGRYSAEVDLTNFICDGNVHRLDLRYNDISSITISQSCQKIELQHLNLDYNFLTGAAFAHSMWPQKNLGTLLSGLKTFNYGTIWPGKNYQTGLWDDDKIDSVTKSSLNEVNDFTLSPHSRLLVNTSLSRLSGYDIWLKDTLTHCGYIDLFLLIKCLYQGHTIDKPCELFQCLSSNFDIAACSLYQTAEHQLRYFSETFCDHTSCLYNIQLPFPPRLSVLNIHQQDNLDPAILTDIVAGNKSIICIHPHNNLQVLHLPYFAATFQVVSAEKYYLSGLHKLKYLNLYGNKLPIFLTQLAILDYESLVEVNVGGSKLARDDILPIDWLTAFTRVSLFNLSNCKS